MPLSLSSWKTLFFLLCNLSSYLAVKKPVVAAATNPLLEPVEVDKLLVEELAIVVWESSSSLGWHTDGCAQARHSPHVWRYGVPIGCTIRSNDGQSALSLSQIEHSRQRARVQFSGQSSCRTGSLYQEAQEAVLGACTERFTGSTSRYLLAPSN